MDFVKSFFAVVAGALFYIVSFLFMCLMQTLPFVIGLVIIALFLRSC